MDDCDYDHNGRMNLWRGAVKSAIRGARGQKLLSDLIIGLDSLPAPRLIASEFEIQGEFCALGAAAKIRGLDIRELDIWDSGDTAKKFNVSDAMIREITWINDECGEQDTPEERFLRVYNWIRSNQSPENE